MKKYVLLLLLPFFALTCDNGNEFGAEPSLLFQVTVNDDALPQSLKDRYFEDAIALTLLQMMRTNLLASLPIEIPADTSKMFYTALVDVYNAKDTIAWDSLWMCFELNAYRFITPRSFVVYVDTNYQWTKAWMQGSVWTGNEQVDGLLRSCAVEHMRKGVNYQGIFYFEFTLSRSINTSAVCAGMKKVAGVIRTFNDTYVHLTKAITGSITTDGILLSYYYSPNMEGISYSLFIDWKHCVRLVE